MGIQLGLSRSSPHLWVEHGFKANKVLSKVNSLENENRVILLLTLVTKKKFSPHDSTRQFYVLQSHSVASSAEHADILYKIFLIFAMIKMIICKIKIITIIKKKKNVYYKIIILLYCLILIRPNQNIRMISEGSCKTEVMIAENSVLPSQK